MATSEEILKDVPARNKDAVMAKVEFADGLSKIKAWIDQNQFMLILMGCPGSGKTYTAVAICMWWFQQYKFPNVEYVSLREMFSFFKFLYSNNETDYHIREKIKNVDYLILDDLGASKNTEWQQEVLLDILDARWSSMKPTIITTNLSFKKMIEDGFDGRIISRLNDCKNLVLEEWKLDRRTFDGL